MLSALHRISAGFSASVCIATTAIAGVPEFSRSDAINIVLNEVPLGADTRVWCPFTDFGFGPGFEGLLPQGSTVRAHMIDSPPRPGNVAELSGPAYFFWLDDHPNAGFSHDVRFVYVDATEPNPTVANGGIYIEPQGWWPAITPFGGVETEYFDGFGRDTSIAPSATNPFGFVFGPFSLAPVIPPPDFSMPRDFDRGGGGPAPTNPAGIVISGVADGADGTYESAANGAADAAKQQMKNRGVTQARLQDKRNANKADLTAAVTAICNLMPAPDKIYLTIFTHGLPDKLCLGSDGSVGIDEICMILKPLGDKPNTQVCIYIGACHSGSLVDDLRPKFPNGLIITEADKDNECWGDTVENDDGTTFGDINFFFYRFIQCWNDATADEDGDGRVNMAEAFHWVCMGDRPKVKWKGNGMEYDTKTKNPAVTGLPTKTKRFMGTDGAKYFEIKRDTDMDGAYDQCDWSVDKDCDGNIDVIYLEDDKDEDGKKNRVVCTRDEDDDGDFDRRYVFEDPNDDGTTDNFTCQVFTMGMWVDEASAPRVEPNGAAAVFPPAGNATGNQPVQIATPADNWLGPNILIFMGGEVQDVFPLGPNQFQGLTGSFRPGPADLFIVDPTPSSPTFGFKQYPNAFQYNPVPSIDFVEPPILPCDPIADIIIVQLELTGPPMLAPQGFIAGIPAPTTQIDPWTYELQIPLGPFCDSLAPVSLVDNPPGISATLDDALRFLPPLDVFPPDVLPPLDLILTAGPSGFARTPESFDATGTDDSLDPVSILRTPVGPLPVGFHKISFEGVDSSGNRTKASSLVQVNPPAGPCPGDVDGNGVVNVNDISYVVFRLGNSGPPGTVDGDADGNGVVNVNDISFVVFRLGNPCP